MPSLYSRSYRSCGNVFCSTLRQNLPESGPQFLGGPIGHLEECLHEGDDGLGDLPQRRQDVLDELSCLLRLRDEEKQQQSNPREHQNLLQVHLATPYSLGV